MKDELTQIVEKVQKDKGQFELLYSQIINKVYFWCFTIAKNETLAKDMTQEVMIRIYANIDGMKYPEYFNSWMYRLVRNTCVSYLRKNKRHTSEILNDDELSENFEENVKEERLYNLPKESYISNEKKELVRSFIDNLPNKQREVVILYYLEEFKIKEIAEILNYNPGSVRTRLHAARKSLELQIEKYQEQHDTKLYSVVIIPILGMLLEELCNEVSGKQDLHYDKNTFDNVKNMKSVTSSNNSSFYSQAIQFVSSKLVLGTITVGIISVLVFVVAANYLNQPSSENTKVPASNPSTASEQISDKLDGHPYITDISYLDFPMRQSVTVTIKLKKEVNEEDIYILFNNERILSFEVSDKDILVQVKENGIYTINIDGYDVSFNVNTIDAQAPELIEARNHNDHLQLYVNDEYSKIDYSKSYVEYQGNYYKISKSLMVSGEFNGLVKVTLFHNNGSYISYHINLE